MAETVSEVKAGTLYKYTMVAYAGKATFTAVDTNGKTVKKGAKRTLRCTRMQARPSPRMSSPRAV